ncbi:hypothetical protein EDB89DRAFT_1910011 [Lactarius sanguifluus]|nr:hypothetical protein EDB89DRAFT_1910011 [Lactarius sanguifluus]
MRKDGISSFLWFGVKFGVVGKTDYKPLNQGQARDRGEAMEREGVQQVRIPRRARLVARKMTTQKTTVKIVRKNIRCEESGGLLDARPSLAYVVYFQKLVTKVEKVKRNDPSPLDIDGEGRQGLGGKTIVASAVHGTGGAIDMYCTGASVKVKGGSKYRKEAKGMQTIIERNVGG